MSAEALNGPKGDNFDLLKITTMIDETKTSFRSLFLLNLFVTIPVVLLVLWILGKILWPHTDQWVLRSYDEKKGYAFVRSGVEYQTECFATGRPVLGVQPNEIDDTNPDAMPPNLAEFGESSCQDILPYLGKSVPHFRQVGTALVFTEQKNYKLEFLIRNAR